MKKSLIVLLIAVLAMGSVFAADPTISGSVTATAKMDLDEKTFSFSDTISPVAYVSWTQYLPLVTAGEGSTYVDFGGTLAYVPNDAADLYGVRSLYNDADHFYASISTFKIVGEKWTLDLYPTFKNVDYATDVVDKGVGAFDDKYGTYSTFAYMPYSYQWTTSAFGLATTSGKGVSFSYDGIGTVSITANRTKTAGTTDSYAIMTEDQAKAAKVANPKNTYTKGDLCGYVTDVATGKVTSQYMYTVTVPDASKDSATSNFAFLLESEEQNLTDDVTAQAALSYSFTDDETAPNGVKNNFGASVKAAYKDVVTVASDMGFVKEEGKEAEFDADVALHIDYAPVTLDGFYATKAFAVNTLNGASSNAKVGSEIENLLSFKAVADVEEIDTEVTFTATNVVDETARRFGVKLVNTSLEDHKFTLALTDLTHKVAFKTTYFTGIALSAKSEVTVNEDLTAYVGVASKLGADANKTAKPVVSFGFAYDNDVYAVSLDASVDANAYTYYAEKADFADYVDFAFKASYTADLFTASVGTYLDTCTTTNWAKKSTGVSYKKYYTTGYTYTTDPGLYLNLNLTSTTLVDGATLALDWTTGALDYQARNLASKNMEKASLGTVKATCKVTF